MARTPSADTRDACATRLSALGSSRPVGRMKRRKARLHRYAKHCGQGATRLRSPRRPTARQAAMPSALSIRRFPDSINRAQGRRAVLCPPRFNDGAHRSDAPYPRLRCRPRMRRWTKPWQRGRSWRSRRCWRRRYRRSRSRCNRGRGCRCRCYGRRRSRRWRWLRL